MSTSQECPWLARIFKPSGLMPRRCFVFVRTISPRSSGVMAWAGAIAARTLAMGAQPPFSSRERRPSAFVTSGRLSISGWWRSWGEEGGAGGEGQEGPESRGWDGQGGSNRFSEPARGEVEIRRFATRRFQCPPPPKHLGRLRRRGGALFVFRLLHRRIAAGERLQQGAVSFGRHEGVDGLLVGCVRYPFLLLMQRSLVDAQALQKRRNIRRTLRRVSSCFHRRCRACSTNGHGTIKRPMQPQVAAPPPPRVLLLLLLLLLLLHAYIPPHTHSQGPTLFVAAPPPQPQSLL